MPAVDGFQQCPPFRITVYRLIQRDLPGVALLHSLIVDQAVADGSGRQLQEGASAALIRHRRLVEGEHGNAELIVLPLNGDTLQKLCRFRLDERQILPDKRIGGLRVLLRRSHAAHDLMLHAVIHSCPSIEYG